MKRITLFVSVLMLAALMMSCNQGKIDELNAENQELAIAKDSLNSNLVAYMQTFNEIEKNLAEIKEREDKINLTTSDNVEFDEENAKESVVKDIQAINALMMENRDKMAELQNKLNSTNQEFKTMVNRLNSRLKEKDNQIVAMKSDLEQLNIEKEALATSVDKLTYTVDTLENRAKLQTRLIAAKDETISSQKQALNTAFVAIGTYKDLKNEQVVDKEGGILGIGSTEKLNKNLNEKAFRRIDKTNTTAIPVFAKKIELVTVHPEGSYEISRDMDEQIQELTILNPDEFWKSSKYLVVMVD